MRCRFPGLAVHILSGGGLLRAVEGGRFFVLTPRFVRLLASSHPTTVTEVGPLIGAPFIFFFTIGALESADNFFGVLLLVCNTKLPPLYRGPLFCFCFFLVSNRPIRTRFFYRQGWLYVHSTFRAFCPFLKGYFVQLTFFVVLGYRIPMVGFSYVVLEGFLHGRGPLQVRVSHVVCRHSQYHRGVWHGGPYRSQLPIRARAKGLLYIPYTGTYGCKQVFRSVRFVVFTGCTIPL